MRACEGVSRYRDSKALPDGVSAATLLGGGDLAGGSVSLRLTLELCCVLLSSCKLLCSLQDFSGWVSGPFWLCELALLNHEQKQSFLS